MPNYLSYDKTKILDESDSNIESMYDHGYVFTRIEKGLMNQTKSLRIDLSKFSLTSENRRILRKTEDLIFNVIDLPINSGEYDWHIHKIAKDFYSIKFGYNTFSASKIKELVVSAHNFNKLFSYIVTTISKESIGYCICRETQNLFHYCYPFYDLEKSSNNMGMGMMLKSILWAQDCHKKYVYLGSLSRPGDKYKLQFNGLEVWDNEKQEWETIEI